MIESRNEANKNLEKALRTLAQAKQKVGGGKKKQNEISKVSCHERHRQENRDMSNRCTTSRTLQICLIF